MISICMPTIKTEKEVQDRIDEINKTATGPFEVIVVSNKDGGVAENRNACLKRVRGSFVIFVDDDLYEYPQGWNEHLINPVRNNGENILMTGPRLLSMNGSIQATNSQCKDIINPLVRVKVLPGACMAYRKNNMLFNEAYKKWGWDDSHFELEMKKQKPKGQFLICNNVRIKHKNESKNMMLHYNENKKLFMRTWRRLF